MPELKLGKLPDRTPAKITITVLPDLHRALQQYASVYRTTYGEAEAISELIPFMIGAFLESDRGFAKARKDGLPEPTSSFTRESARRGRRASSAPPPTVNEEA
ncbi:DUF2274 domain-containing protein [Acidocella sp.]|uniref:DUF2274 domain-containing protein n=1 Tax=Acidocella sp. TaxID=50710 RepID=UPI002639E248|nr:DUF2274 domain-containing protein [Acidocella sp.]